MKPKVLVVEDDARIARLIRANLTVSGYTVTLCQDGEEALRLVDEINPDLILLDVMLPGMDGFTVCQRIREFSQVPIIMVTAKDDPADRVRGLDLGADDYLVKPFVVEELLARVRAVIRRSRTNEDPKAPPVLEFGPLSIRLAENKVYRNGQEVKLTPTEFRLLAYLARNHDRTLTHDDLLTRVWGPEYRDALEYLRVTIARLRRKIEEDPARPAIMMYEAMEMGADVVGGVPYNDTDPYKHIDIVFEIAKKYDKPIDLHQDFTDDADGITIEYVCRKAIDEGFVGRVAVGHLTALGAVPPARLQEIARLMKEADISVFSLPATDLHLGGRKDEYNVRRALTPIRALRDAGVNVCLASNNIRNAFTPFGLGDPLQIAMLAVHAAHLGGADDLPTVLPMVTTNAARALGLTDYGLEVGKTADLVVLDTKRVADAVIDQPARLLVMKSGRVVARKQITAELLI